MKRIFLLAAALTLGAPAAADEPAGPAKDSNELICKSQSITGSRLGARRVCQTRAQWENNRAETRRNVDRAQKGYSDEAMMATGMGRGGAPCVRC
jgi:hypothetical protein